MHHLNVSRYYSRWAPARGMCGGRGSGQSLYKLQPEKVRAEKAAGGFTAPLPMSSQQGGALPREGLGMRHGLSPCRGVRSCGCPGEAGNECWEQGSPAPWAWLIFLQENQAGSHTPCLVGFGGLSPRP